MTQSTRSDHDNGNSDGYTKTLLIHTSPQAQYESVTTVAGVRGWWSDNTSADNGEITVRFGEIFQTLRLVDATPDKSVG